MECEARSFAACKEGPGLGVLGQRGGEKPFFPGRSNASSVFDLHLSCTFSTNVSAVPMHADVESAKCNGSHCASRSLFFERGWTFPLLPTGIHFLSTHFSCLFFSTHPIFLTMKTAAIFSLLAVAANAFVLPTPKAPQVRSRKDIRPLTSGKVSSAFTHETSVALYLAVLFLWDNSRPFPPEMSACFT